MSLNSQDCFWNNVPSLFTWLTSSHASGVYHTLQRGLPRLPVCSTTYINGHTHTPHTYAYIHRGPMDARSLSCQHQSLWALFFMTLINISTVVSCLPVYLFHLSLPQKYKLPEGWEATYLFHRCITDTMPGSWKPLKYVLNTWNKHKTILHILYKQNLNLNLWEVYVSNTYLWICI